MQSAKLRPGPSAAPTPAISLEYRTTLLTTSEIVVSVPLFIKSLMKVRTCHIFLLAGARVAPPRPPSSVGRHLLLLVALDLSTRDARRIGRWFHVPACRLCCLCNKLARHWFPPKTHTWPSGHTRELPGSLSGPSRWEKTGLHHVFMRYLGVGAVLASIR